MANLSLPKLTVGMTVVTPTSDVTYLTADTKYIILAIEGNHIKIQDDTGEIRSYQSFLFIEPDVYYTMLLYLSVLRLFNLEPNDLK